MKAAANNIGYLNSDDPEDRIQGAIALMTLICEPLLHRGPYDFANSRLSLRASELGFDLAFRRGYMRAPPPATVFLHRKLVGSFLICARIRARVDVRALMLPFLKDI